MRRVENETATRVQFLTGPESSGKDRQCKISGTRAARAHANREIERIIRENNKDLGHTQLAPVGVKGIGSHAPALRAGEDATQIMVPNRTVGLIIGRGGETIRDLQERSACHVNIVGEEKSVGGFRPVNLIGTPQAAAVARELIMEIVDSDNKNNQNASRDAGRGQNMYGGGDEKINDNIVVPSEAVGMIIGRGLPNILASSVTSQLTSHDRWRDNQRHATDHRMQNQRLPTQRPGRRARYRPRGLSRIH